MTLMSRPQILRAIILAKLRDVFLLFNFPFVIVGVVANTSAVTSMNPGWNLVGKREAYIEEYNR